MVNSDGEVTQNQGEWVEVALKIHLLLRGSLTNIFDGEEVKFDGFEDGPDKKVRRPLKEDDSRRNHAEELLAAGIIHIGKGEGSFTNPLLMEARELLEIIEIKANPNADGKADAILIRKKDRVAVHVENTKASRASFANASKKTRITFNVSWGDGRGFTADEVKRALEDFGADAKGADGKRNVKTQFQKMQKRGYKFEFDTISDPGFARQTKRIGHKELALFCLYYLGSNCAKVSDVLAKYKEGEVRTGNEDDEQDFEASKKSLLRFIKDCIRFASPTKVAKKGNCTNGGMVFLHDGKFYISPATEEDWWLDAIEQGAAFDTPDSHRHDCGYLYLDGSKMKYKITLGIRGSFYPAIKKQKATVNGGLF